ncbi:MAG: hypothetical protein M1840_005829 [Geoglossum simile]|nr:MAG: hypothetical protein M1840_005829 [Geoglossum simile]
MRTASCAKVEPIERQSEQEGGVTINVTDPILDRVRPEVREEALRLQQRLRQLIAEGNSHAKRTSRSPTAGSYDKYNDNAPFPYDVRVNDKVVEVLAPVEPKNNGKKYSAARKSASRWQPLPPRQIAQLGNANTPSVRKARQEHQRHLTRPTPIPRAGLKPTVPSRQKIPKSLLESVSKPSSTLPSRSRRQEPKPLPQEQIGPEPITGGQPKVGHQGERMRLPYNRRHAAQASVSSRGSSLSDPNSEGDLDDVPMLSQRRAHRQILHSEDSEDDQEEESDDYETYYSPVRRQSRGKVPKPLKSMATLIREPNPGRGTKRVASPVLFPASRPPPKLFIPAQELRRGYEAVAMEKEMVHPTFDPHKTHSIDRHMRSINTTSGLPRRQSVKPLNMRVRQSLDKPVPRLTIGSQDLEPQPQPQVPDIDLGEEAYRGRVYRTIERDRAFEQEKDIDDVDFNSLFGDNDEARVVVAPDRPATPEPERDWRERYLPTYMEEAEADPYAAFFQTPA